MTDSTDNARGPDLDRLISWGFAPGSYMGFCSECGRQHTADKRAWRCLECAERRADLAPDPLADPRVGLTQAATIAETIMQKHAKAHYSGEAVRVFKSGDDTLSESAAKAYCAGEILEAIRAALAALSPTGGNADG